MLKHTGDYGHSPGSVFAVWDKSGTGKTCAINAPMHCDTPCLSHKALSFHFTNRFSTCLTFNAIFILEIRPLI